MQTCCSYRMEPNTREILQWPVGIEHMYSCIENLGCCHVTLVLEGKKTTFVVFLAALCLWTSTTHYIKNSSCHSCWFNCPQFSSHPGCLSTRLAVFCVYLRDSADTTAARLITFPLTAWPHSQPVVFCCIDSDLYYTCWMWISFSLTSDWKAPLQHRGDLHSISAAGCVSMML